MVDEIRGARDDLIEEARMHPGCEVRRTFGKDVLGVGIFIDVIVEIDGAAEMVYFGVQLPENEAVYGVAFQDLLGALLPLEANANDLTYLKSFPHRDRLPREFIVRWDHFLIGEDQE